MVTGQLPIANQTALVLIDSGVTRSFTSPVFARKLDWIQDRMPQTLGTMLPSRQVLLSNPWVHHVPLVIESRELHVDLIVLDMIDFDVILGMDFLGSYYWLSGEKCPFSSRGRREFQIC